PPARPIHDVWRDTPVISLPGFRRQQAQNGSGQQANGSASSVSGGAGKPQYDGAALEALVERAERAAEALRSLGSTAVRGDQFAEMEKRIAGLEGQITTAEQLAADFA